MFCARKRWPQWICRRRVEEELRRRWRLCSAVGGGGATGRAAAQVLTSMETVAGNYKVMDGKIGQKEAKMQIMEHKCGTGPAARPRVLGVSERARALCAASARGAGTPASCRLGSWASGLLCGARPLGCRPPRAAPWSIVLCRAGCKQSCPHS